MHIFWIAGLLLAMIDLPDFGSSLGRIAESTEKIAGIEQTKGSAGMKQTNGVLSEKHAAAKEGDGGIVPIKPSSPRTRKKEPSHA